MALFNFLGNAVPANVVSENNTLNFGLEFEVIASDVEVAGFRYFNAEGGAAVKQMRLYAVAGQTVIYGPVNMPTDAGWVEVMVPDGPTLAIGSRYKVQVWLPVTQLDYGFTGGVFASGITSGPGYAFSDAQSTQGQGSFNSNGFASYATSDGNGTSYFADIILFQPDPPSGATVAGLPSEADRSRVLERIGIPAGWPDDVALPEPLAGSGIVVRSAAVAGGSLVGGTVVQPQGNESVGGAGTTAVDPVAGTVVATTAAIPTAGLYRVEVRLAHIAGTAVAIDDLNYAVRVNTTNKVTLAVSRTNGVFTSYSDIYVRVTVGQTINVAALGTGTAGVRDSAVIIATKVAD